MTSQSCFLSENIYLCKFWAHYNNQLSFEHRYNEIWLILRYLTSYSTLQWRLGPSESQNSTFTTSPSCFLGENMQLCKFLAELDHLLTIKSYLSVFLGHILVSDVKMRSQTGSRCKTFTFLHKHRFSCPKNRIHVDFGT